MTKTLSTYVYSRTLFYKDNVQPNDYLVRANANEEIIAWAITSRNLVEHARQIHNLSPICTAALGRSMSAALMMGNNLKNEQDVLTLQFNGNGPMRGLVVSSNNKGEVKGYTKVTDVIMPPNAARHLNVGGAIGEGTLTVIRDYGLKDPYVSTIELQTGEIAEDLTYYFASSEQTPSVVALGVLMNKDVTVKRAGGLIVQLLPNCPEESITKLERNLRKLYALTDLLDEGMTPEDMLTFVLEGFDVNITEKMPVQFKCNCSKERSEQVLISIGKKELEKLRDEDHKISLNCQFCGSHYDFDENDINELISQID
ncbi:MAG: Hsp33 family molecular chaperone HslO [Bacilli bacterium]|nr:Hsp33 family molecular chaperone HslO [Bacilli bacterium]